MTRIQFVQRSNTHPGNSLDSVTVEVFLGFSKSQLAMSHSMVAASPEVRDVCPPFEALALTIFGYFRVSPISFLFALIVTSKAPGVVSRIVNVAD